MEKLQILFTFSYIQNQNLTTEGLFYKSTYITRLVFKGAK